MDSDKFEDSVRKAIGNLIQSDEFINISWLNWNSNKGREEEFYPFFNEFLRSQLCCQLAGLGYGKPKNGKEKIDCLCYFLGDVKPFGIELKGPSKDIGFISKGLDEDLRKLQMLVHSGHLFYGIAVGIYLSDSNNQCDHKITQNSKTIYIKMEFKNTQQNTE